ncbi:hypothetical protein GCM10009555_067290 [Acrocarpospora macrocephala]|uniref:Transglycosylase SLT domain-containing protein n=1 Tax=Acrocarpospora macrocephala TaxID=150177 RepID=A0A5M3WJW0_9ACTN|nr:lytic transglycosylase domain-containing protein [Acrocarpospora macrocephala]GES09224.1 hypothetical protein Amac_028200 [Acrocarpospora macrocephala]
MLTPKRIAIMAVTVAVIAGGTTWLVKTSIYNNSLAPQVIDPAVLAGDFESSPQLDALKAHAAAAIQKEKIEADREGRKPLDPAKRPTQAPGGGGFPPIDFPTGSNPDPGSNKALGKTMNEAMGWSDEWGCLEKLWDKESGWNERAMNRYSGAYGIPQSLPGSKMASAGSDWQTNSATQIKWGLGYIKNRYGSPCGAWGHSQRVGWY